MMNNEFTLSAMYYNTYFIFHKKEIGMGAEQELLELDRSEFRSDQNKKVTDWTLRVILDDMRKLNKDELKERKDKIISDATKMRFDRKKFFSKFSLIQISGFFAFCVGLASFSGAIKTNDGFMIIITFICAGVVYYALQKEKEDKESEKFLWENEDIIQMVINEYAHLENRREFYKYLIKDSEFEEYYRARMTILKNA